VIFVKKNGCQSQTVSHTVHSKTIECEVDGRVRNLK